MRSFLVAAVVASASISGAQAAEMSSGSGVVIGLHGEVLTNAHVVEQCTRITVRSSAQDSAVALVLARDDKNDLAVVRSSRPLSQVATFRDGPIRAGDAVVALGYPLAGLLATTANLTVGNVSALAGLGDDSRYLQISAPVQPGNSGGPLLDGSGHLIGIVTGKLDAALVERRTGDIPQNVNFALKAEVARTFLDSKGIPYRSAPSDKQLSPADVGDIARPFTLRIECEGISTQVATPSPRPQTPSPNTTEPMGPTYKDIVGSMDCTKPQGPKGLAGTTPDNQWFVVVGSYGSAEAAAADANQLKVRFPGKYEPQICAPTTVPNSPYRVVVARYMTYSDAAQIKNDAIAAGLPSDTWLWNPFAGAQ